MQIKFYHEINLFLAFAIMICLILFAFALHQVNGEETFSAMYRNRMRALHNTMVTSGSDQITSILDVGANTGTWSKMIKEFFPEVISLV